MSETPVLRRPGFGAQANETETKMPDTAPVTPREPIKSPGIVGGAASSPDGKAADSYQAPETKPVTTQVDAQQETVESRLNNLTSKDSKFIQLSENEAMRSANSRGLINSTMAAGAGRDAAIRNALPIAQQDAKTYTDTRMQNQSTENDFLKNRQSADLNKETATHQSRLSRGEATHNASLNESMEVLKNNLSMERDKFSSDLQLKADRIMNDEKFSDEVKLQYVTTVNNILRDSQDQITQIGLSDRSAEQQAGAIDLVQRQRDASVRVYEDLLGGFGDWDWGTDFTPDKQGTSSDSSDPNVRTVMEAQGYTLNRNGQWEKGRFDMYAQ